MGNLSLKQIEIAKKIDSTAAIRQWNDWKWQIKHAIKDVSTFEKLLDTRFSSDERWELEQTVRQFPLHITPYYLSLINTDDMKSDPVYKQCFPSPLETGIEQCDMAGPLAENEEIPVPGVTHHSQDRVLFQVGNVCRQCTRERKVCDADHVPNRATISKGIEYIRKNPSVHDVLLSGGDPMMLPDDHIDGILAELDDIPHVEAVRIGTRVPAVLPCRITDRLVEILKHHHQVRIITHFNHPNEVTVSSHEALRNLTGSGILLENQCVPIAGVNDSPQVMKRLLEKLIQDHVRPYYQFHDDLSEGIAHFRTSVSKGVEIVENLITHTGGFSMPAFVVSAPGGGKIQVTPNYQISCTSHKVVLRNY